MWVHPTEQLVVGEVLAAARQRAGISQKDLAAKLGKPQSFVSSYENGQRRVDVLEFIRIASRIDSSAERLFRAVLRRSMASKLSSGLKRG